MSWVFFLGTCMVGTDHAGEALHKDTMFSLGTCMVGTDHAGEAPTQYLSVYFV